MSESKNSTRFFLQRDRVHTALTGSAAVVCMRAQSGVLAETRLLEETTQSALLAADIGDSVLRAKSQALAEAVAYSAYGVHNQNDIPAQRPAFNGHLLVSHLYLLGNGYRGYNSVLMRFHSPDSLSPFAAGGLNCYAYCAGDPINFSDPSGHMRGARSRSPSPLSKIVLDVLEAQPGWRSTGGNERSMSPASLDRVVLDALNSQPGWNGTGTPVEMLPQRTLTSSPAQAQPIPGASGVAQKKQSPVPTKSARVRDVWKYSRRTLKPDELKRLERTNAQSNRSLIGLSVAESREVREVAITALRDGQNVMLALKSSRFKLSHHNASLVQNSVYQMYKIRSRK